jgi:hypothetical protein
LIPGETIIKLYYCKRMDGYVTSLAHRFRLAVDSYTPVSVDR